MIERDWYKIKNVAEGDAGAAEVWIYERIGADFWSEGVQAKDFVREIAAITAGEIVLHINSPGGSVFDGTAIFNALRAHPAAITVYVDGLAASIASVIALAGDRVVMARNALFMVHNPVGFCEGDAEAMRKYGELLDLVAETIAGAYIEKTGKGADEIAAVMDAETWFSAEDALAFGLVDEITAPLAIAAGFDLGGFGFRNAPEITAAGRVLSAANEATLRDAVALIESVLDSAGSAGTDSGTDDAAQAPDVKAAQADPETVRVLVGGRFRNFTPRKDR